MELAEGEFLDAIADGTVKYPSNANVIFNYMNGTDFCGGRFMESTYTPNAEWINLFFESVDKVKNGSTSVDDFIAEIAPQMQASLDEAWDSVS